MKNNPYYINLRDAKLPEDLDYRAPQNANLHSVKIKDLQKNK